MAQVTLRDCLQETEDAIRDVRIDDALTRCHRILAQFPELLEAQRLLGEIYLAQEKLDEAQRAFDWVLTNDPENVIVYCNRALVCERRSDYDTALDCYQQAYELSRGNAKIRNKFNKLSAKIGQQGFMFSRAGLARLYMRGDLLTQAVQEWEVVLTTTPERLDARTGLLEAYWRDGLYDRVEQLAMQILQDVPGCVKALLLLAYVTSARKLQEAQELLKRVETLDADFVMAQDLFADVIASQPNEPFLQLLRRLPVKLETSQEKSAVASAADQKEAFASASMPQNGSSSPLNALSGWSGIDVWNSDGALALPPNNGASSSGAWSFQDKQQETGASSISEQGLSDLAAHSGSQPIESDVWQSSGQEGQAPGQKEREPWELLQESLNSMQMEVASGSGVYEQSVETQAWDLQNNSAAPALENATSWAGIKDSNITDLADTWSSSTAKETDLASRPAWLSMLTQGERRQMTGEVPSVSLPPERPEKGEVLSLPSSSSPVEQKPLTAPLPVLQQPVEAAPVAPVVQEIQPPLGMMGPDEEESFFGPEWLKALGAATMEEAVNTAQVAEPVAPVSSQEASAEISSAARAPTSVWGQLAEISHAKQPFKVEKEVAAEIASIAKTAQHVEETEKAAPMTLETLEHNLRFSDFGSLEQSLHAAVAQGQEALVAMQPDESDQQQRMYQEPTLSAALAELENFGQPLTSPVAFAIAPDSTRSWSASVKPSPAPLAEEPAWLASLRATPIAPPPLVNEELPVQGQVPTMPVFATEIPVARPAEPPARVEAVPEPVSVPTPALAMLLSGMVEPVKAEPMKVEPVKTPVAHVDPFLDIELETTMKRPAIRLQPMQQRPASQGNQPASVIQGRTGEWLASKEARGSMSHRERLLKGYQHQLVGDYDEAMQEYRLIIRNVPELLGEVISNIRALLKLAPKYAAGYRVLGDAYMCQGEYLQAMEAYNKALTMAKKAKA